MTFDAHVYSCGAAFPELAKEWVDRGSRRIWRHDQVKHEYWNQQASAFKESRKRGWVLKAGWWDWQMSSHSDHLPHKEPSEPQYSFIHQSLKQLHHHACRFCRMPRSQACRVLHSVLWPTVSECTQLMHSDQCVCVY